MHTTTFIIESVHGVKQTFVLGPLPSAVEREQPKPETKRFEMPPSKPGISPNNASP